ncbi:hypothetical protein BAZSYMA_ACONTIG00231_10 [Bathymodiolus azoricus thioautotrophic gill symbiont]|uniref:Uncharacterized protein n=1 Tax=Bathymodiolus azoricus thioautotrophic gill symbiont TaxID=235205 RepID=A0A1H6MWD4_9GAMM|nr:hypothetical protein BAZSYMA_ACONTIG00231_10 [Bathymodiolus azoricus thioautotrophic gill symbiont]
MISPHDDKALQVQKVLFIAEPTARCAFGRLMSFAKPTK